MSFINNNNKGPSTSSIGISKENYHTINFLYDRTTMSGDLKFTVRIETDKYEEHPELLLGYYRTQEGILWQRIRKLDNEMKYRNSDKFRCLQCDSTLKMTSLKPHLNRHLGIYPYQCSYCKIKKYTSSQSLKRHIDNKHLLNFKYECTNCDKKCMYKSELLRHVNITHNIIRDEEIDSFIQPIVKNDISRPFQPNINNNVIMPSLQGAPQFQEPTRYFSFAQQIGAALQNVQLYTNGNSDGPQYVQKDVPIIDAIANYNENIGVIRRAPSANNVSMA